MSRWTIPQSWMYESTSNSWRTTQRTCASTVSEPWGGVHGSWVQGDLGLGVAHPLDDPVEEVAFRDNTRVESCG